MKHGFTLAEILITVGIVGTVAAVTMPALLSNSQKNGIGPAVAKAYNTLNDATNIMLASSASTSVQSVLGSQTYAEKIKKYAKLSTASDIPDYKKYSGGSLSVGSVHALQSSDGMLFLISSIGNDGYNVYVDTNGLAKPNTAGKDLFLFFVSDDGSILPYGGSAYGEKFSGGILYESNCYVDSNGNAHVSDALTCTGFIADNGWKVLY